MLSIGRIDGGVRMTTMRSSCKECGKIFETKSTWYNQMMLRNIHGITIAFHYLKTHKKMKTRAIVLLFNKSITIPFKLLLQAFIWILEVIAFAFETVADWIDYICIFLKEVGE